MTIPSASRNLVPPLFEPQAVKMKDHQMTVRGYQIHIHAETGATPAPSAILGTALRHARTGQHRKVWQPAAGSAALWRLAAGGWRQMRTVGPTQKTAAKNH
jgi:hypothetical protein